jgi:hypothetical protein
MLDRSVPSFTRAHRAQVDRNSLTYPIRLAVMQRLRSRTSVLIAEVGIRKARVPMDPGSAGFQGLQVFFLSDYRIDSFWELGSFQNPFFTIW